MKKQDETSYDDEMEDYDTNEDSSSKKSKKKEKINEAKEAVKKVLKAPFVALFEVFVQYPFESLVFAFSNTDRTLFEASSVRAQMIQKVIGITVVMAALTSAVSMGFLMVNVFQSSTFKYPIVLVASALWFFIVGNLERGIFLTKSSWSLILRALMIFTIAMFTSVPFKLAFLEDRIKTEIYAQQKDYEAQQYGNVSKVAAEYRVQINEIDNRIMDTQDEKNEMERLRDAEEKGLGISGATGEAGKGKRWKGYNEQVKILDSKIRDLRRQRSRVQADMIRDQTVQEGQYSKQLYEFDDSFLSQYIVFKELLESPDKRLRTAVKEIHFGLLILFMLIELFPVILKVMLGKENSYMEELVEMDLVAKDAQNRRRAYMSQHIEKEAPKEITGEESAEEIQQRIRNLNKIIHEFQNLYKKNKDRAA